MAVLLLMALGATAPFLLYVPSPPALAPCLAISGLLLLFTRYRLIALLLLPMAWTLHAVGERLADRLPADLHGAKRHVPGIIAGLPEVRGDFLQFEFRPLQGPEEPALPRRIAVRWYTEWPDLRVGELWRLHLRLKPPRSRVNFSGPDGERTLFAGGFGALATVGRGGGKMLRGAGKRKVYGLRQLARDRVGDALRERAGAGLVLALAVADRSSLDGGERSVLARSGTGHLLAISGLHVGLAALFGFWLGRACSILLPTAWRLRCGLMPGWIAAITLASAYAGLAGFGTSTQRALVMLLVLALSRLLRRPLQPARPLAIALILVLLLDPVAPLRAGFWLSFGAVAILLLVFTPRTGSRTGLRGRLRELLQAQVAIMLGTLPLGMFWFQQTTVLGFAANIVAIPWVSFVVVPLVLCGQALVFCGLYAGELLLQLAALAGQALMAGLTWLVELLPGLYVETGRPGRFQAMLALAGAGILLLPRGIPGRPLALFMVLPLLLSPSRDLEPGQVRLEMLDVGQGLSVLVGTRRHALLYDAGPGQPGSWDLAESVLVPAVAEAGYALPDRIMIGHGDLDHAGGLASLAMRYPEAGLLANLGAGSIGCDSRQKWNWDHVGFQVLHPDPGLPYLGNASSCVLSVRTPHGGALLSGDIDSAVEARLVSRDLSQHRVLVAPHHGSKTSSSPGFVRALDAELVLFAAGYGNRFGFPNPEVVARYRRHGARTLSTADCGAVRVTIRDKAPPMLEVARRVRGALWRYPAGPGCAGFGSG